MTKTTATILLLCLATLPAVSTSAVTRDVALHELDEDVLGSIPFDAGADLTEISAVKLILRGSWTPSLWSCPGFPFSTFEPGADYVYGEIRDDGASFAFVYFDLSGGFGREVAAELYYNRDWSPLLDGVGIIDLMFFTGGPVEGGFDCGVREYGSLSISEAILRFEAAAIVDTEAASWSALKATYR